MQSKVFKRLWLFMLVIIFIFGSLLSVAPVKIMEVGAATQQLNTNEKTLKVGKKYKLQVKNCNQIIKWSSSKKSVATVSSKGIVKAKKKGTAIITAKVGTKELKCKIHVLRKHDYNAKVTENTIRKSLGIPSKATIKIQYGNKYFWDAGGCYLVYVNAQGTGKYEGYSACATFDVNTGEICTDILMWQRL